MFDFENIGAEARVKYVDATVTAFLGGDRLKAADVCRKYYATDNPDIAERAKCYASIDENGNAFAKSNPFASNEKVASSFFRDITDQKTQYLMGEGADVNALDDTDGAHAAVAAVYDLMAEQLKRNGQEALNDALVYGGGYTYMQVIAGRIKLTHVPYCEVHPICDDWDNLEAVARIYKRRGAQFCEIHTPAKVYEFAKPEGTRGGKWQQMGERWQIQTVTVYGDGTTEASGGKAWPVLPWFEMRHNNDHTTSLTNAAKTMIRVYDITVSDFANNLVDVQDVFITLKKDGYGSGLDYGEQLDLLRKFKVTEGEATPTTVDIPFAARQVLLDMLKGDIYAALRGVDVGRISGGNLTNTAIRALYSDIDLWADQAEWWVKDWVCAIMDAVAAYMGVTLPLYRVTLKRNAIFDEVAQMDAVARQKGVISDKTLFEAHPLVEDAQAELERIEAETAGAVYANGLAVEHAGVE